VKVKESILPSRSSEQPPLGAVTCTLPPARTATIRGPHQSTLINPEIRLNQTQSFHDSTPTCSPLEL